MMIYNHNKTTQYNVEIDGKQQYRRVNENMKNKKLIIFLSFMIIMIVMGASDSLRGIFSYIFQEHYEITSTQISMVITASYVGNLVFLLFGGVLVDRFNKKKVFLCMLLLWMLGTLLFLTTDSYIVLIIGMFICMGASTLINTTINIITPLIFVDASSMIVNVLYFIQGIGTSASQNVVGRYATGFSSWKVVNLVLLLLALLGLCFTIFIVIPSNKKKQQEKDKVGYGEVVKAPAFPYLILILGFYFIAEHGILNWLVLYGTASLQYSAKDATMYLSIFFGGMTAGRLIFAPFVQKLGIFTSIKIFAGVGCLLYITGFLLGKSTILLLSISGFALSIIYPTLILMIQRFYRSHCIATAAGIIISIATLFDISFNICFGILIEKIGFGKSIFILPISILAFYIIYLIFRRRVKPLEEGQAILE